MDKGKLITKIIFGEEEISKVKFPVDEETKKSFEIAWDIWENFERQIRKPIRAMIAKKIYDMLKEKIENEESFQNYKIINKGFLDGRKLGHLLFFPDVWLLNNEDEPILSYSLEYDIKDYYDISYGIIKKNKNIPFRGYNPTKFKELLEIQKKLENIDFESSEEYLVWKWFKEPYGGMWQLEFYEKVIIEGVNKVASYYVNELKSLIEQTQDDIDNFIEKYKKEKGLL
ncbi:hypothetical protein NitYY0826_C1777 [Nitratiruptor sp. YY08-26]|uniref:hypothetical protein n=1 Tax=unclassified Nitratiruptor TaxID=2624044 RepID=UPI0019150ABC|nr:MULTISPECIES: hypothetical protein [unclassified Nitratiruptor]BCD62891.1 hypothetical protein NitYY0813_C1775 [Nitratiruptor sp. YY08-13]BCD66827.1 hypothetical protein NitYY0826_C1777 [Nitratiruptor sp. YY08-26]